MEPIKIALIVALVVFILLVFMYFSTTLAEHYTNFYLDQMAEKNSDPMYFKYSGWERDVDGMSPRDYYLENQTNYLNQIAPGYFEGDGLYSDKTGYLNMPPEYRPRPEIDQVEPDKKSDSRPSSAASIIRSFVGVQAENDALNNAATEGFY